MVSSLVGIAAPKGQGLEILGPMKEGLIGFLWQNEPEMKFIMQYPLKTCNVDCLAEIFLLEHGEWWCFQETGNK